MAAYVGVKRELLSDYIKDAKSVMERTVDKGYKLVLLSADGFEGVTVYPGSICDYGTPDPQDVLLARAVMLAQACKQALYKGNMRRLKELESSLDRFINDSRRAE